MLKLHLEGKARILGVGNGDPSYLGADHSSELNCKEFEIPAFNGYAQVLVQSDEEASQVKLTATSEGLEVGIVDIELVE